MKKYKFSKDHQWIRFENLRIIKIGITEYAQKNLGDIIYVNFNSKKIYKKNEIIGSLESVKSVSDIYPPVTGEIIEFNLELKLYPELINSSPYDKGWIALMKLSEKKMDKYSFLSYEEYKQLIL